MTEDAGKAALTFLIEAQHNQALAHLLEKLEEMDKRIQKLENLQTHLTMYRESNMRHSEQT